MTKQQTMLEEMGNTDVPASVARRVYGNRTVNALIRKGHVSEFTVDIGNRFELTILRRQQEAQR